MRASVLIPSRKRPAKLTKSIRSILDLAAQPEDLEIIVRLDHDDGVMLEALPTLPQGDNIRYIVGPHLAGYCSAEVFWNDLARLAHGRWLVTFNDDATMQAQGWDLQLDQYTDPICLVLPEDNYNRCSFPIVPRKFAEVLGHLTVYPGVDTYLLSVFNSGEFPTHYTTGITIEHHRPDLPGKGEEADEVWLANQPLNKLTCDRWNNERGRWAEAAADDIMALNAWRKQHGTP